ncbi:MAG: hypothetical protein KAH21_06995 [Spirochaetaceae bacterium]|nr:hypothetical protein [Spirochaetaceae bacterium]
MRYLYFLLIFLTIPVLPIFAYLDPGTGSMIVSAIIGAVATVAFIFKGWFYKIFRMFRKKVNDADDNESAGE